jgi:hypothetical protein
MIQIKEDKMGGACTIHVREEKRLQILVAKSKEKKKSLGRPWNL